MKIGFSKETKIALLTIVTGTMLYTGFNFLKGRDTFSKINYYYVIYGNVGGLVAGNPVNVNGLSVGQVKDLLLEPDNTIKVVLQINSDVKITDSTVARLEDGSLLGGKGIELAIKPGKPLEEGGQIAAYVKPGISQELMKEVDKTLDKVNEVLGPENQKELTQILKNVATLTAQVNAVLETNKKTLASSLENVNKLTAALVETEKQIKPVLVNLNAFADSLKDTRLKTTVEQANKTIANLDETISKINNGKGSMGKLINDDSLYVHMDKAVKDLDKLFLDINARPNRYVHFSVFGKKDKQ